MNELEKIKWEGGELRIKVGSISVLIILTLILVNMNIIDSHEDNDNSNKYFKIYGRDTYFEHGKKTTEQRGTRSTSGWMDEIRLTNSPGDCYYPDIAFWDSNLHVVWVDERDGSNAVYYKRSIDNGKSWGSDIKLSSAGYNPNIAVYKNNVHVVWNYNGVNYVNSTDNGLTFGTKTVFDGNSYPQSGMNYGLHNPDITVWQNSIFLSASAAVSVDPFYHVIFKRSSDNGNSWTNWILVRELPTPSFSSIETDGNIIYITYLWGSGSGQYIEYNYSSNLGNSWSYGGYIASGDPGGFGDFIPYDFASSMHGSGLHVVYPKEMNSEGVYSNIYNKVRNWPMDTISGGVDVFGNYIIWSEIDLNNKYQILSNKNGQVVVSDSNSYEPNVVCNGSSIHLVWVDDRDGNLELYYSQRGFYSDLVINNNDIILSPSDPVINSTNITINATIFSYGKTSLNVSVKFFQGNPDKDSDGVLDISALEIGNNTINIDIDSSSLSSIQWTPSSEGNYTVYVWVDPSNDIPEYNYTNNIANVIIEIIPGIFTLNLEEGWNLISIPLQLSENNISALLHPIENKYDALQWFDTTESKDHWKHFHISKPTSFNDLGHIDEKKGYWINITEPGGTTLNIIDDKLTISQQISLYKGWNLVGYPSLTNHNRTVGLNNLFFNQEVDAIQWFDSLTRSWHNMSDNDHFEIGRGYWIHATTDCVWEVPL